MQPRNAQPVEPSSIVDECSHIRPLNPEAVLEENDNRSVESRKMFLRWSVTVPQIAEKHRIVILMVQQQRILELEAVDWIQCWQITLHRW